jgi:hypothetical protein
MRAGSGRHNRKQRPGRWAIGWFTGSLFGIRAVGRRGARHLKDVQDTVHDVYEVARPRGRLGLGSFRDRYGDGGIERFRQLTSTSSAADIEAALSRWQRDRKLYLAGCVLCFAAILALFLYGITSLRTLSALGGLSIVSLALSIKADFRVWQIRQRRVGSLASYLSARRPAHVHILPKDRS